jgi:hypothetical protein
MKETRVTPPQVACPLTPSTRQHFATFPLAGEVPSQMLVAGEVPSQMLATRIVGPKQLDASGHIRDFSLCVLQPAEPCSANKKHHFLGT